MPVGAGSGRVRRFPSHVSARLRHPDALTIAVGVAALSALPRLLTAPGDFITADEPLWMNRADGFHNALASGDLQEASATRGADGMVTMPGVTTMWIGMVGRSIWALGDAVGWWENGNETFRSSTRGLDISQGVYAVVAAAAIGIIAYLVAEWIGRPAAFVAGMLLATEPFLVGHGAVLHTDELTSFFGVASLLAAALVLGLPTETRWAGRRSMAVAAGLLFALAWLTKLSAMMFLVSMVCLLVMAAWRERTDEDGRIPWRRTLPLLKQFGIPWLIAAGAMVVVTYPALWTNPIHEVPDMVFSSGQTVRPGGTYFMGEARPVAGPLFYLVALPLRMTPWFLVAGLASAVAIARQHALRGYGLAGLAMAGPPMVVISVAAQQFDRYGLPVIAIGAVMIGLVTQTMIVKRRERGEARAVRQHLWTDRVVVAAGGLISVLLMAQALVASPWGITYFNPLLGGPASAETAVDIGWGEGTEQAVAIVEDDLNGECRGAEILIEPPWVRKFLPYWGCGTSAVRVEAGSVEGSNHPGAYFIAYIKTLQRWDDQELNAATAGRDLIGTVEMNGLTYAEVYGPVSEPES